MGEALLLILALCINLTAHGRDTSLTLFPHQTGVNEDVERVRRAHLNDMENILPFFCLGLLYIFTNPALSTAVLVFRIFAACRITHSIVYLLVIPQPARALAFFGGMGCNLFMGYKIVTTFM